MVRFQGVRQTFKICVILIYTLLWCFALFNYNSRCRETLPEVFSSSVLLQHNYSMNWQRSSINVSSSDFNNFGSMNEYCHLDKNYLKLRRVDAINSPSMETLIYRFSNGQANAVKLGGQWSPSGCIPYQSVAILIAYRNRYYHLKILLNRLHQMLRLQKIKYHLFLLEQSGEESFNRGMLMNVGIVEALNIFPFDCFIFHDVDLIPEHDRNIYMCDDQARHLVSAMDEMRFNFMYYNYVGGVLAMSRETVMKTNGFSNVYWGWGNEDDDMSARTETVGLLLTRPPRFIGRYKMIRHLKAMRSDNGYGHFMYWRGRQFKDGLNSISSKSYRVIKRHLHSLYTNVTVVLNKKEHEMKKEWLLYKSESLYWFLAFFYP